VGSAPYALPLPQALRPDVTEIGPRARRGGTRDPWTNIRPHVGAALRLIHGRPAEDWSLDRLAREVGLSRTIFADRFNHYVKISPMQYLARWRLQLAGRLLEKSGISIAQAGAEVGYESEAAFNRAFKKLVGVPPGTWRKARLASIDARPSA
jgi:AraC-like DNA-binding protein